MAKRANGTKTKRVSRGEAKRRLLGQAAETSVPESAEVVVCGGGAAGLAAAIVAAEAGARVVVLECDLKAGRTILATGNGRCNFSNARLNPGLYHNADFVREVVGPSWEQDVLDFFCESGLAWTEESEGRLYPMSRQAASVRECLIERAGRAGVTFACARRVTKLWPSGSGIAVAYQDETADPACEKAINVRACIVSTGHAPALADMALSHHDLSPVLCPIALSSPMLSSLDGRRAHASLTLMRDGKPIVRECGEVLFRTYGISGIAAFNLSRHVLPGDTIVLDLMPDLTLDEARRYATHTLKGLLDPRIAEVLEDALGSKDHALDAAKAWPLEVLGLAETERAQVMRGGIEVSKFDPATLGAHVCPGLFAAGEALDVDGPCGGYNLAWAWKSGMVAGSHAAACARHAQGDLR